MSSENLRFDITLKSTHWDKKPMYSILIDDEVVVSELVCDQQDNQSFYKELSEGEHTLGIKLLNKENSDCVQNENKTAILKDMQLHVSSISIDNIELKHIKHTCSTFVPTDTRQHETLQECVDLGWNGTYILKFTSPFYIWLLENM
jgi:hypothetical protein